MSDSSSSEGEEIEESVPKSVEHSTNKKHHDAVIVGGVDMTTQALALAKRTSHHSTPGRLVDHLENTKGFNLRALKYLVMDEADRILNMDFEVELDKILRVIPKDRRTYLFSATMTKKVAKLERASLKDPARVEVSTRYKTVDKLRQHYLFIPFKYKEAYLVYLLNELAGNTAIVFCATCNGAMQIAMLLRQLGMEAVPLHGQMGQEKRLASLNKFKSKVKDILVCTDVASRGLDIPHVDLVINYDVPSQSKDYIHRVGRTARAGRAGLALTLVSQYDVEKLTEYPCVEKDVMLLVERTQEANEMAVKEIKEIAERKKKGKKRGFDDIDDSEEVPAKFKKSLKGKKGGGKVIRKGPRVR
ncbi:helicase protein [Ostertagia ostertagi]